MFANNWCISSCHSTIVKRKAPLLVSKLQWGDSLIHSRRTRVLFIPLITNTTIIAPISFLTVHCFPVLFHHFGVPILFLSDRIPISAIQSTTYSSIKYQQHELLLHQYHELLSKKDGRLKRAISSVGEYLQATSHNKTTADIVTAPTRHYPRGREF
jgi:hypothetical protein